MRLWRRRKPRNTFKNGDRVVVIREGTFCGKKGEVVWDESQSDTHFEVKLDRFHLVAGTPVDLTVFFKTDELLRDRSGC